MRTILTIAFVILLATDVRAMCFKPADVERQAKEKWNERVTDIAPTSAGELVRLYQNDATGTWTLTIIQKSGLECVLTDGEGWRSLKPVKGDPA